MLDEFGSDTVGQVCWHMIEHAGPKLPHQHEDLEIGDGKAICGEVAAATGFQPLL